MRKKSPQQSEKDELLSKKATSDQKWEKLIKDINQGEKIDFFVVAQAMSDCNWADYGLIMKNLWPR